MKILKIALPICCMILITSCTKEEDPVKVAEVEVTNFVAGHLTVKLLDDPAYLDSIIYTNNSQGTSFKIKNSSFLGYNSVTNPITSVSRSLFNGEANDQVQCCFYVNSTMNVGVSFEDLSLSLDSNYLDSIPSVSTGGNPAFCITGSY